METSREHSQDADLTAIFDTVEYPEAYRILYLANAITTPAYADMKRDYGMVRADYILLVCLSHYPTLTAQDVANISRYPRNTISRAVHHMARAGLLTRRPDPNDGRQSTLQITTAGREMYQKLSSYMTVLQERVLDGLEPEERETLARLLQKAAMHTVAMIE